MASYEFPASDSSDDEPHGDNRRPESGEEPRLTKLGSNIPIPSQSDMPESEGPQESLYNHALEVQPAVTLINSVIMPNIDHLRVPEATPSSVTGKLKRPSLGHFQREPSPAPRGDIYDIPTLPETVVHPSSSLLGKKPSKKPQKTLLPSRPQRQTVTASRRGMMDTDSLSDRVGESHSTISRVHQTCEFQEPLKKRQKLDEVVLEVRSLRPGSRLKASASDRTLHDARDLDLSAPISTSGRVTRSSKQAVTAGLDLSRPTHRQRGRGHPAPITQGQPFVPENDLSPSLDKQQAYSKSLRRGHPGSRQVVEVVIDESASIQLPSESTNTSMQSTAPPAIVQNPNITTDGPIPTVNLEQDRHRDRMDSGHPVGSMTSALVDSRDAQKPVTEKAQRSTWEDNPLFEPCTQSTRDARSGAEILSADLAKVQELNDRYGPEDDPENDLAEGDSGDDCTLAENCEDEENNSGNIFVPEELSAAVKKAHCIRVNTKSVWQEFDGIRILKSYSSLKRSIWQWRAAENYSETSQLIQLSQKITQEAKAILQKSAWNQQVGLEYIHKHVLPTLVRMLYITLVYYLSEVGTMEKLPYEPLKESRSIVGAILHISNRAKDAKTSYPRPQDAISMVARIKKAKKIFDKCLTALETAKSAAESAQRQQTQRLRQEAVNRENEDEDIKLKEWRQRWVVLHDQRLGAAMEGRIFLSDEQGRHLRQIPLDEAVVVSSYWDETQSFYLVEGLQNFKGPNVYRKIFRKYCRHGGPLQGFNVAEIVDKAVSLKGKIMKLAEDDGDELQQWVKDIFDPRVRPEGLRGSELPPQH